MILGLEFDLRILAAMLAILGYSLNDTIIIYDRIRENMELHTKRDLPEVLNLQREPDALAYRPHLGHHCWSRCSPSTSWAAT